MSHREEAKVKKGAIDLFVYYFLAGIISDTGSRSTEKERQDETVEEITPETKSHSTKEMYCASTVIGSTWSGSESIVTFKNKKVSDSNNSSDFHEKNTKKQKKKINKNVGVQRETPELTRKIQKDLQGFVEENNEESFHPIHFLSDSDREIQDDRVQETDHSKKESYCASTVIGSKWSGSESVVTFKNKKSLSQVSESSDYSDIFESIPRKKIKKQKKKKKGPKIIKDVGVTREIPDLTRKTKKDKNIQGFVEENNQEHIPVSDNLSDYREHPDRGQEEVTMYEPSSSPDHIVRNSSFASNNVTYYIEDECYIGDVAPKKNKETEDQDPIFQQEHIPLNPTQPPTLTATKMNKIRMRIDSSSDDDRNIDIKKIWIEDIKDCQENPNCMYFLKSSEKPKCNRSKYPWSKVKTSRNRTNSFKCTEENCPAEQVVYKCRGSCRRLNKLCCAER